MYNVYMYKCIYFSCLLWIIQSVPASYNEMYSYLDYIYTGFRFFYFIFFYEKNKTKTYVKIYLLCWVVSKGHKCIMHKRMKYFLNSLMVLTSRRATLESFSFYRFKYFSRFWNVHYYALVKTQLNTLCKMMFFIAYYIFHRKKIQNQNKRWLSILISSSFRKISDI